MTDQLHIGTARLVIEGADCGSVVYSFSIGPDANPRGVLSDNVQLMRAAERGVTQLTLGNGLAVRIQIYEANKMRALFKLDGPALFGLLDAAISAAPGAVEETYPH